MHEPQREITLAIAARRRGGVFTSTDALGAGFSRGEIRSRLRTHEWHRLRTGVFALQPEVQAADARERHRLQTAAALATTERTWASASSAAVALRLELLAEPTLDVVHLARPAAGSSRVRAVGDLQIRECGLPKDHLTSFRGVRTMSSAHTAVDLARDLPTLAGVVVVDSAMRRHGATGESLDTALQSMAGWAGRARAAAAVELADPNAESVLESVSRVELVTRGLTPEPQVWLAGPGGYARADFLWWRERTIGEADGMGKYAKYGPSVGDPLVLEKLRHHLLEEWGFEVVRWTWAEIRADPDDVAARVRRAFARSAVRQEIRARNGEHDLVRRLPAAPWDLQYGRS